ncbi:hypothetical protein C3B51_10555 [Pseudoalteromonas rubra]|uniref:Uncharacterized protein n=1 Tax=Pseudoalteromonas rubra TaxID=43658 RepID=A0A4Q7ED59_9GAMM|nr:hypothetical protein C3B51_10555 [Pseudoalteromonas rubra]
MAGLADRDLIDFLFKVTFIVNILFVVEVLDLFFFLKMSIFCFHVIFMFFTEQKITRRSPNKTHWVRVVYCDDSEAYESADNQSGYDVEIMLNRSGNRAASSNTLVR